MESLLNNYLDRGGGAKPMIRIVLIFFIIALCFLLTGCVTAQKRLYPSENIIYYIMTPFGPMAVLIEKDFLNEENRGKKWMTEKEYDQMMEEMIIPEEEESNHAPIQEHTILRNRAKKEAKN